MAFMGRGNFPSVENSDTGDVIMQIIVTFIILIVEVLAFIITYKSTIIDSIENIKKLFINVHLINYKESTD